MLAPAAKSLYGSPLEMSTSPTTFPNRMRVSVFSAGGARLKATKINADGTAEYKGVPVFRSGTFRDNRGVQHTYEPDHMDRIVENNAQLLRSGNFTAPPVRADHSVSIKDTIGYATGLYAAPSGDSSFLLADFEVTEPDQVEKIERGTYRFRSAEIGYYETNNEALYWPVFMGFAFVDIPAVEGLDAYARDSQTTHFSMYVPDRAHEQEPTVPDPKPTTQQFSLRGVLTSDYKAVQAALDAAAEAAANPPAPPVVEFRIDGSTEADQAKVQRHIDALENFRAESVKAGREAFVDSLAKDGKILATQVDGFKSHVGLLGDPEFEAFKGLYAEVPANSLFGKHDGGEGTPPPDTGKGPTEADDLRDTIAMHRRAGLSEEAIAKTNSYKRLQALESTGK